MDTVPYGYGGDNTQGEAEPERREFLVVVKVLVYSLYSNYIVSTTQHDIEWIWMDSLTQGCVRYLRATTQGKVYVRVYSFTLSLTKTGRFDAPAPGRMDLQNLSGYEANLSFSASLRSGSSNMDLQGPADDHREGAKG